MSAERRSLNRYFVLINLGDKKEQVWINADRTAVFTTLEEAKKYVHKIRSNFESENIPEIIIVKEVARYRSKNKKHNHK